MVAAAWMFGHEELLRQASGEGAAAVRDGDELDAAERERLHQALVGSVAQMERGEVVPFDEVLAEI